jgi:hypothetical protein
MSKDLLRKGFAMNDTTRTSRALVPVSLLYSPRFDSVHPALRSPVNERPSGLATPTTDEDLIADARANLTPAQMVERKLVQMLRGNPLPVSHMLNKAQR